ncbi:MAG: hypothetical protein E6Y08_03430 [Paenibacillus sp.]|uniref:hypothetical protein n=1 Tax=Paenibacillus sp. TaxID=58172 RepID=UPI00290FB928|nr:hypothetical protein [Paenibacillus sp.]MDU4694842.1 hypothetical protein [Paenibacillus sp.]
MKNWFAALLPLALVVMLPALDAKAPESVEFLAGAGNQTAAVGTAEIRVPETVTVYLNAVDLGAGGGTLSADPILWYQGEEAAAIMAEREPEAGIDGPPNGYYIVNDEEEAVTYPVSPDAEVRLQIYDRTGQPEDIEIVANEGVSLQKFGELFGRTELLDLSQFPYHVTLQDGKVVRILQQYVP